ncbi:MAG: hypothetical protein MI746_06305 [Pseudomonadales bacterium]|nr:hypothetical protein [Pseudomonadales bacterium]
MVLSFCLCLPAEAQDTDAVFQVSSGLLSIPPFDVPSLGRYTAVLELTDADNLRFTLNEATLSEGQADSAGSYSVESQVLSLFGLRALGIRYSAELVLTSEDPAVFTLTTLLTSPQQMQDCEANDPGNGNEIVAGPDGPEGEDRDSVFRSLTVSPTDAGIVYVGTERNGVLRSLDGGDSWQQFRSGFRHAEALENYPEIWDMVIHPLNNSVVYAATLDSPGPVSGDYPSSTAGVYKSIDGGVSWIRGSCGLSNSRVTAINIDPVEPSRVYIGVEGGSASFSELQGQYFEGGVYVSSNDGSQWNKLAIDGNDTRNGYWRLQPYGGDGDLITFGFNFEDVTENIGFVRISNKGSTTERFADELRELIIPWFTVSADGQVIYAIERDAFLIRKSINGGLDWTSIQQPVNGPIEVSPLDAEIVLFAQSAELRKSEDGGLSAAVVLQADAQIHDIVFAPSDPTIVYVATEGYFIYKSIDGGNSFTPLGNLRQSVLNTD